MKKFTSIKKLALLALLFVAGNVTAQTVILSEDFSKCTGFAADPDNPSEKKMDAGMDPYTLVPGWTCVNGYAGEGNAKFGGSSKPGSLTTPSIDLSDASATYTLKFKACAWANDKTSLKVQVDNQEAVEVTGLTNAAKPYVSNLKDFSVEIKGTATSKITISSVVNSKARFFLDDIEVVKLASGEVADPDLSAPSAVSFGTIGTGNQATEKVVISGTNLTEDLKVAVEGDAFSCATTTIAKDDAVNAELEVVFAPVSSGEYKGTLTISGGGLKEAVEIPMSGKAIQLTGQGTKEAPYTSGDVLMLENPGTQAWVTGYIVGYVPDQSVNEAVFGVTGEVVATNLLIADKADVTDYTKCVVVQLPKGDVRTALNLLDNPGNLGKQVSLLGDLTAYFSVCGIKNTSEYFFGGSSVAGVEAGFNNAPVEVYTLGGVKVSDSLNDVQKGIYIVKQGTKVRKVVKQ